MSERTRTTAFFLVIFHLMLHLITILDRCHRFPGFVYQQARFSADHKSIEICRASAQGVRLQFARAAISRPPAMINLPKRRFEFIPFWGFLVFLLYSMRRVDCRRCEAVVVEEVPWGDGKRTLTRAYMLFLARWARCLSWKETAEAFRTSWEKVFDAVEHVVTFGLEHRGVRPDRCHRSRRDPVRQRAEVSDAGLPDRSWHHAPALGQAEKERSNPFRDSSPSSATKWPRRSYSSAPICGSLI